MALIAAEFRGLADGETENIGNPDLLRTDGLAVRESPFLAHSEIMAPAVDRLASATSFAAARIESSISSVVLTVLINASGA